VRLRISSRLQIAISNSARLSRINSGRERVEAWIRTEHPELLTPQNFALSGGGRADRRKIHPPGSVSGDDSKGLRTVRSPRAWWCWRSSVSR